VKRNINGLKNFNIFGVLDGHGYQGHLISKFAAQSIPNQIINHPDIKNNFNYESLYFKLKQNNYYIIRQTFNLLDKKLQFVNLDSHDSGSTCVLIIHIGKHIICANVGDSRAIAVNDEQNDINLDSLRVIPLSIDFKPELPNENNRIMLSGGEVRQTKNDFGIGIGPYRVYMRGTDYPGLAMSRSIGDLYAKDIGVISEPGIMEYNLSEGCKFIVICSDGVWEFLTNENVKNIGKAFYLNNDTYGFCQELIKESVTLWKENDSSIDDITAIAIFF